MKEIKSIDFNISKAIGDIQKGIPSALQPRMARLITHKIFSKHSRLEMCYGDKKGVRKAILKTIDTQVMPTLSGITEVFYDNYVLRGEDIQGIQPKKGEEEQILFYKNYVYKKYRHPCVIEDSYVYTLNNKPTGKEKLKESDILIVDDKGVVRYLSEDSFKMFEKVGIPYYIGETLN
jgi:hypothetical protein